MSDLLKRKEEFVQYSLRAFENHDNNRVEESAILARKAGEAAVKILFHKNKQKLPFRINERSGLKELIQALREHTNIPNQTINQFETLQLTGNKAAHDSSLSSSDLDYAINALKLLIVYFYESIFVEKIPTKLSTFIKKRDNKEELLQGIKNLRKQIKNKSTETNGPNETLQQKLEELENKIKSIEEQNAKQPVIISPIKELTVSEIKTPESVEKIDAVLEPEDRVISFEEHDQITKPKSKRKLFFVSALLLFVISVVIVLANYYFPNETKEKIAVTSPPKDSDTVLRIAIFNFDVLNDNPVVKLPIEQDIEGYLKTIATDNKVGIQIVKDLKLPSSNIDSIRNYCFNNKIHLAIFGNVSENKKGDSCSVQLNYQFTFKNQRSPFYGSLNPIKTDLANLSGYSVLKKESAVLMNFGVGVLYYDKFNYSKAASLIKNLYSDSRYLMMNIYELNAIIQLYIPDYEQSKQVLSEFIKEFPDSAQGYVCYANTLITAKEPKGSLVDSFLQLGERANKNYAQLWHMKSLYAEKYLNDSSLIHKYSKRAFELSPNDYDYMVRYAHFAHYITGKFDTSAMLANKASKIYDKRYEAYFILGECALYQGKFLESIPYFKKEAEVSKNLKSVCADAYLKIGTAFYNQYSTTMEAKYIDSAIYYYQKSLLVSKTAEAYSFLGSSYLEIKDTVSFVRCKTKALKLNPNYAYVVEELATLAFQVYRYESMLIFAKRLLQIKPTNANAHILIGYYYLKVSQKNEDVMDGLKHINLGLHYNNKQSFAWACKGSYFQYRVNNYDSAIYCYKNAYGLDSTSADALFGLAQSHLNNLDYKKAFPYFKKCYQVGLYLPETNMALAYCYLNINGDNPQTKNNLENALFHAKNAYNLNQNSAEANFTMASVFVAGNNSVEATNYYNRAVSLNPAFKNATFEVSLKKVIEDNAKNSY